MMLRRRIPRPTAPCTYRPSSSGPRGFSAPHMRRTRASGTGRSRSRFTMPAMPHMSLGARARVAPRARRSVVLTQRRDCCSSNATGGREPILGVSFAPWLSRAPMATPSASQPPLLRALGGSRLPALDGLRAVAVGVVMVYHFGINAVPGDLGVSAFFVLSGFLITWLLLKEHGTTGDVSLRQFYTRRVLRIFPAPSALLYLVNYFNALHGHPTTSIAHAWSLGIEEQFYLLWPLLLLGLLQGGVARVARALVFLIVVVVAWRCVLLFGLHVDRA